MIPDIAGNRAMGKGAYTSKDPAIRRSAIAHTKEVMDIAVELGCPLLNVWPGQDGYDYFFQADYIQEHGWMEEALSDGL